MTKPDSPGPQRDAAQEEWEEFFDIIRANVRQHAGYFCWLGDRTIEEAAVVEMLHESLLAKGRAFFHSWRSRGGGNDPPDCEAFTDDGKRIAIEVTELVDGNSIAATKRKEPVPWQPWKCDELRLLLEERIRRKDAIPGLKDGPYAEYILIIYTDEPRVLDFELVEKVAALKFGPTRELSRAFLLMSYSPWHRCCPFIELCLRAR